MASVKATYKILLLSFYFFINRINSMFGSCACFDVSEYVTLVDWLAVGFVIY